MTLSFSRSSTKFLAKCELKTRAAIVEAIRELPGKGDIRKLKGQAIKNSFRLRVGRYRVVYVEEGDAIRILRLTPGATSTNKPTTARASAFILR